MRIFEYNIFFLYIYSFELNFYINIHFLFYSCKPKYSLLIYHNPNSHQICIIHLNTIIHNIFINYLKNKYPPKFVILSNTHKPFTSQTHISFFLHNTHFPSKTTLWALYFFAQYLYLKAEKIGLQRYKRMELEIQGWRCTGFEDSKLSMLPHFHTSSLSYVSIIFFHPLFSLLYYHFFPSPITRRA